MMWIFESGCLLLFPHVPEGKLKVGTDKKKLKDRYVILCDGLLIVCSQQNTRRPSSSSAMSGAT